MILKIKAGDNYNWVYFDNVKKIQVEIPENYFFINYGDKLLICEYIDEIISTNSIYIVDQCILDENVILSQFQHDENGNYNRWGVKIIKITFENNDKLEIACYTWNDDIYILNNEGKTIERL